MALALHGALSDLIEMSTDSCHLELNLALMQPGMTRLAEGEQVLQCILAPLLFEDEVVCLEAHLLFATVLTRVVIPHQAGNAQVFIKPCGVLIPASRKLGIVQARDIDLHIFDNHFGDGKWNLSDDTNHLLDIRFDGRGQASTALA